MLMKWLSRGIQMPAVLVLTGAVLAFVSSGILGQYDPFAAGGGELLLVYPKPPFEL